MLIDIDRRRSDRNFRRHWRLVRQLRLEAQYVDLPAPVAALLVRAGDGYRIAVARGLSEVELDVVADLCAIEAGAPGGIEQAAVTRRNLERVLGHLRSGSGITLEQLARLARG